MFWNWALMVASSVFFLTHLRGWNPMSEWPIERIAGLPRQAGG
jgi:hypothetical protein